MLTLQYSYFALRSEVLSARVIADRLRLEPDEVLVLGSRRPEHRIPRYHSWKLVRRGHESVDEQIQHIVDRLAPVRDNLIAVATDPEVVPVMQVVRYFHHEDGVEKPRDASAPGDPRPLGWNLSAEVLGFLAATGASLDVDEYDLGDE
ncbi:DUF4279 domain-containing protein [Kibdelosporangium phytohabitans]|uniref:DUF4279 domain-containing protein n=1 Tax=Kibdelosporangium phytohabitans TaxID=860235 RepID=A0A0N9I3I3_9PSEU|nr:DUF4279 domain-containing protein [Kibdelosporangium phytohabitans]ALG10217.1 hypothetical protein AOZ06_27975 [Kibdelosporangium phytohabitans]MBE1461239.1 hypothetical protein [Kibdelosporangium phytohabitans]